MKKFIIPLVLICISDLVTGKDKCKLKFGKEKESKWTKFQRKVLQKLKVDVEVDCESAECHSLAEVEVQPVQIQQTGCRCKKETNADSKDVYDCRCCFKIKQWNFLICLAAAVELVSPFKFFVFVTIDGQSIARVSFPLETIASNYIPICIPVILPPPVDWLSPCFKYKIELPSEANNNVWKLCGKIKIGVYLVPIFTIYAKCFEISTKDGDKKTVDSMKMEGQNKFDEELDKPVQAVKVHDVHNILPVFCVSNKRKEKAKAGEIYCDGESRCVKPVIEINKINWQESKIELSPFLAYLYTRNNPIPVKKLHEDDGYPFIAEIMTELEKEQWMTEVPPDESNHPGSACGGALLTNDKVLTICACVRTFYKVNKLKKELNDDDEGFLFDMPSSTDIYLRFANSSAFRAGATEDYRLDTDGNKMIGQTSECSKRIDSNEPDKILLGSMIVMPFTPTLKTEKEMFAFWPPGSLKADGRVNLVAYGMEVKNPAWVFQNTSSGENIDLYKTAVDFFLKNCDMTEYCKDELQDILLVGPFKDRLKCMCAEDKGFQLVDGEAGFPLTADRQLLGLMILPVDSGAEGSTAGIIFDAATKEEIETYVGKDKLHSDSTCLSDTLIHCQIVYFALLLRFH